MINVLFGVVCVHFHLLSQLRKVRCISVKIMLVCESKSIYDHPSRRRCRSTLFFFEVCFVFFCNKVLFVP